MKTQLFLTYLQASIFCLLVSSMSGCQKNEFEIFRDHPAGSRWKLAGMVDKQTGALKKLQPTDCKDCYTLEFETDSTISAKSITLTFQWNLSKLNPSEVIFAEILMCEHYKKDNKDYCGTLFFTSIKLTEFYTVTQKELKLFVYQENYFLLFKPIK